MSTPCNSLNVQLIKVSSLATYSSIKNADRLMIVENTGGSKYSRQSTVSDLRTYVLTGGFSSFPASSFYSSTDGNNIGNYVAGSTLSFSHGLSTTPAFTRVVLKCIINDGFFSTDDELDITSCYNNNNKPVFSVLSNSTYVKIIVPTFSSIVTYMSGTPTPSEQSLNLNNWCIKLYVCK